ncbi:nuclease [Gracilibacillus oryzae]|uniref:Nuclease n=1 Tax=Gracilibacillus oryzae TaxID=1672701 RepID=A0A7C8KSV6_9BACI|nr:thermonuclease family protein [Gracilibacillus oryzae]KAB8139331.1 nuclease [Gracilibacillus oryzae]
MNWKNSFSALLIIMLLLAGCGTAQVHEQNSFNSNVEKNGAETLETAEVLRVIDGDTVKVRYKGKEETVRLLLVDTPETKHPDLPVQPFGPEASAFAEKTLDGKDIQLEFDGPRKDHYGRLLAYVWVDGVNFNELLVKEGYARYAYIIDPPYVYQDEMEKVEEAAKSEMQGIWSIPGYVTEHGFNQEIEKQTEDVPDNNSCLIKGNIGSDKIYHTQESPWYEQTKAEVMFCTEMEAIEAGFRAPRQ